MVNWKRSARRPLSRSKACRWYSDILAGSAAAEGSEDPVRASISKRSVFTQSGPPAIWNPRTPQAIAMRFLRLAPAARKPPPGSGRKKRPGASGGLGFIEATSKFSCWPSTVAAMQPRSSFFMLSRVTLRQAQPCSRSLSFQLDPPSDRRPRHTLIERSPRIGKGRPCVAGTLARIQAALACHGRENFPRVVHSPIGALGFAAGASKSRRRVHGRP
jgi:hypothetical protein